MKKIAIVIMALVLLMNLTACGSKKDNNAANDSSTSSTASDSVGMEEVDDTEETPDI